MNIGGTLLMNSNTHLFDFGNLPAHLLHKQPLIQTHSVYKGIDSKHSLSIVLLRFHLKYYADVLISITPPSIVLAEKLCLKSEITYSSKNRQKEIVEKISIPF